MWLTAGLEIKDSHFEESDSIRYPDRVKDPFIPQLLLRLFFKFALSSFYGMQIKLAPCHDCPIRILKKMSNLVQGNTKLSQLAYALFRGKMQESI